MKILTKYYTLLLTATCIIISGEVFGQTKLQERIQHFLYENIDSLTSPGLVLLSNEGLESPLYVNEYYLHNNYQTAWLDENGVGILCDSLIKILKQSNYNGLYPEYYRLSLIDSLYNDCKKHSRKTTNQSYFSTCLNLELLLTDAFITYATDLYAGHIHTLNENVDWANHLSKVNIADSLKKAIVNNCLSNVLANFSCIHQGYIQLKMELEKYINEDAFKADTGLSKEHFNQIKLNMERWRWLPHVMAQPYIMVNIADFSMCVIDSDKTMITMKIIVGKTYTRTPLFNANMTYIVLSPYWEIPPTIARKEILPEIKTDKEYLTKNHIEVYENWKPGANKISPDSINWDSISPKKLTYRFRQTPGLWNALGRIKFMFPNKYNVYLHDTPQPQLFLKNERTFSHGCMRIEKPIELALYLLKSDTSWSRESLQNVLDTGSNEIVILPRPVYVYVCYWTVWIDINGEISFRPDVYEYDKRLQSALDIINHNQEQ